MTERLAPENIVVLTRPKAKDELYGSTGGGAHGFFSYLGEQPDFTLIDVGPEDYHPIRQQLTDHLDQGGGLLIKTAKPKYVGQPHTRLTTALLRCERTRGGVSALMWNDKPSERGYTSLQIRWLHSYLARAKTHGVVHIAASEEVRADLIKAVGLSEEEIQVLPVEIRPEFLNVSIRPDPLKRASYFAGAGREDLIVSTHTRIAPSKKVEWVLDIALKLRNSYNQSATATAELPRIIFAIIGNHQVSEYGRSLFLHAQTEELLEANSLVQLLFLGPIENRNLPEVLAQSDVSLLLHNESPNLRELWQMNAAESFALGLPLITRARTEEPLQQSGEQFHGIFYDFGQNITPEIINDICQQLIAMTTDPLYEREERRHAIREMAKLIYHPGQAIKSLREIFRR